MVQSFQVLINVYMLNITCHHMPKYFQVSEENHPKKHILVLIQAKHTSVFSEKKQTGGSMTYFLETLWNFLLFYFTPGNSRQNKAPPKDPRNFHIIFSWSPLEIPLCFYLAPGNSTCYFLDTPGNSISSTRPPPMFGVFMGQPNNKIVTEYCTIKIRTK